VGRRASCRCLAGATFVALASCATPFFPKPSRVPALDAIALAQTEGAGSVDAASYELALANELMQQADDSFHSGHMDQASVSLEAAQAAAQRATAIARNSRTSPR